MRIAFDAQLIFEKQKTGIGWTSEHILKNIIKEFNNEYYLNYYTFHKAREKKKIVEEYIDLGYKLKKCVYLPNYLYKRAWNVIPIPYSRLFGNKAQITQFFNYDVPPGVNGKAVTFIYDMVYRAFPETIDQKNKKMLDYNLSVACKRADHIITISEFSKNEIIKYMQVEENKVSIMPCGVDTSIYHVNYTETEVQTVKRKYGITGDYLLYLGTLEPRKNIERLIKAYALLIERLHDAPLLVLAGKKGWMYDKILSLVEFYNLQEKIIFTGYIEAAEAPKLLKGSLLFVFPSIYEGFGIPPLEAMACGTPVVVSNQASMPEVIGDAGYYIDPYQVEDICDALQTLLGNDNLRKELSKKGISRAKEFTWSSAVNKLMKIYNKLVWDEGKS
ncbi:Glycosyl transferases group 1 [Anaerocolumna jejuensis DSM 15929]|uniref:Glycosyl transferases group 1 n=1 Tax=Anaerocolumna jejuensis DSM 15929 TaxID=1121322 RepID=A0A1M6UG73_9FIRM|nr:glycosyltransferase family 1 protein [Anaerocolumna jejuensis]SHK68176.1 Glycosyl transferases group 1 [Anaerocolumna jejuensis DSM 15929]